MAVLLDLSSDGVSSSSVVLASHGGVETSTLESAGNSASNGGHHLGLRSIADASLAWAEVELQEVSLLLLEVSALQPSDYSGRGNCDFRLCVSLIAEDLGPLVAELKSESRRDRS